MAPQQKGKQGTKGAKQIVEENKATLKFYRNMALGSTAAMVLLNLVFFGLSKVTVLMGIIAVLILAGAVQFMVFMSRPKYSENGSILDSGNDLNMEGGIAENVKDLIILTSGTILLSLLSNYFWYLLLLAPLRGLWMLWGSVIQPWLSQRNAADQEPELDEKKQRKLERKMRRMR
ncbi:transmembrane protein 208 [Bactrocera neohumeralis]|uniref:Transmembrane protein 208 n=1 Tax=Bactrocera dorsalis TaxID=27457 RepID=A0A034WP29_BACDO|nr:transmembrane protein 208 [Bactrocera tryoni]XP_050326218.1 transmembrane protein 208 [Bactrocera neohumeralis]